LNMSSRPCHQGYELKPYNPPNTPAISGASTIRPTPLTDRFLVESKNQAQGPENKPSHLKVNTLA